MRWSPTRMSVRRRVVFTFGVVALAMAIALAAVTYAIIRHYLWEQRRDGALNQALVNARIVDAALGTPERAIKTVLERVDARNGANRGPLLRLEDRWYGPEVEPALELLPDDFLAAVDRAEPVTQRIATPDGPALAVALPVSGGVYVDLFGLNGLERTLTVLELVFVLTTAVTTGLGLAVGAWATRRTLRPLAAVTSAASRLAGGDMDTRLARHRLDPELDAIAAAFNNTVEELQARIEKDARFAGDVSHELRTPVTTMVNAVEILKERSGDGDAESKEVLDLLADEVHRFAAMVEDLLEIARVDSRQGHLRLEALQLGTLVRSVTERCAGREVEVSVGSDPTVQADRRRLERIVTNLVLNAEVHGGGVTSVSLEEEGPEVRILVDDGGPGIPPEDRERVFERFARGVAATGDHAGAGLGLAVVRQQVRLHGGRVWVEDSPGGGARFVVVLPREQR